METFKMKYRIFKRSWWKKNKSWPDGLEPHCSKKRTIMYVDTLQKAQEVCCEHNNRSEVRSKSLNPLAIKYEFEGC